MTDENRRLNVASEWDRVDEAVREVEALQGGRLWGAAVSRAYYGMFHAARALAFAEGMEVRSHAGLVHLLSLHLVRTGRFPADQIRLLSQAQQLREDADYQVAALFDENAAREARERLLQFRDAARTFLCAAGLL